MNPQNPKTPPKSNQPSSMGQPNDSDPQVVYMSRPMEPQRQQLSDEMKQKHDESKRLYPTLNLSQGEYVISAIRRHPIGLVSIWAVTAIVVIAMMVVASILATFSSSADYTGPSIPATYLAIPVLLLSILTMLFGFISSIIYGANRFYLTNESVIQHIQISLFNQREQTISLANIEDASFSQDGILPHLFDYGLIRLSTQGDETTYRFSYASSPKVQISLLNNAVEDFKNIRPIDDDD